VTTPDTDITLRFDSTVLSYRDVRAGEAIFIDMDGNCHSKIVHASPTYTPCIFEYVYFARPDSIIDGVSVYEARLNMGEKLAETILRKYPNHDIDVVIPIPDTSRTSALQTAYRLDVPFREGFMKNRYIGRTFIMPGQAKRKKSVRLKLNTIRREFEGKNVLLVDDSIVRGTTAGEIVQMALEAGARKVYFSSAAPPIRFPNIYGIDLPTQEELIAYGRTEEEIARLIGCEWVVYQELEDLEESVRSAIPKDHEPFDGFDCSTFSGEYITGERMGDSYFTKLHALRNDSAKSKTSNLVRRSSSIASNNSSRRSPPTIPSVLVPRTSSVKGAMTDSDSSDDEKKPTADFAKRVSERIPLPTF
jgi:amidophosphoribosyltransferase